MRGRLLRVLLLLAGLGAPSPAAAQALVADLSDHLVAVSTGFAGAELLLFGAVEGEGDVVVVVRGPEERATVRRKQRVLGLWINTEELTIGEVPSFYALAASKPLDQLAPERTLARQQIGLAHVRFQVPPGISRREAAEFQAGLIRNKRRQGLYALGVGTVTFLGGRLFRADVLLPSNVPTGSYTVTVYLLRQGEVVSAQTTPLDVSKVGVGARIYDVAHRHAAAYGLLAISIAVAGGWIAGTVFRRD
jgi:uncharacterized protein (TIGR02186 family)